MRVTKIIKDYVYEQVNEKKKEKIKEIEKEKERYENKVTECCAELEQYINSAFENEILLNIQNILEKYNMDYNDIYTNRSYLYGHKHKFYIDVTIKNEDQLSDFAKRMSDVYNKADKAIKDILIDLELGGTKEGLKQMIEKIKF